ncbi:glycoside hydrolase [Marinomonas pollencensis]|uniref:Glycosyl hydrolase family 79 n=1 Tax=Marinomonas pollencensis TaxID=491954 RepID=A0A3E0DT50_9GAMM|nr:glycoside hydrolase [Marinomonas pollencensis]REG86576.1 glycosyl hydrolase family 79 [Marinomonas pollencensis]
MTNSARIRFRFYKPRLARQPRHVTVNLNKTQASHTIDKKYLSFSIDISVLAGGFWWDGSQGTHKGLGTQKTAPLDLQQSKLNKLVHALGPAYLRVGGSEADKLHYFSAPTEQPDALLLSHTMWDELHHFCQRHELSLMFTFKYGLFRKSLHGRWQADEVEKLLNYSNQHQQHIAICELGNELNAYWAFHGLNAQPSARKLAQDYDTFTRTVRQLSPDSKVAGPGSAFWPRIGETIKPISNVTSRFLASIEEPLDIVDWHYYPFQSSRSPVKTRPATLNNLLSSRSFLDYEKYLSQLTRYRDRFQPQARIWTGETGSAQCGGESNLSDRFASSFWWADQLGRGAKLGQQVMVRQSLIGGDYALINKDTLKPNPDYWLSWLWNKLMGDTVYHVSSSDPNVITYCHSAKKIGKCTLLIINMTPYPKRVQCHGFGGKKRRFEVTADELIAEKIRINGMRPKFKGGKVKLKDFPTLSKVNLVSPYSINFWCFTV